MKSTESMDKVNELMELDRIYDNCTEWMKNNPDAPFSTWVLIQEQRCSALKEQGRIYAEQLADIRAIPTFKNYKI